MASAKFCFTTCTEFAPRQHLISASQPSRNSTNSSLPSAGSFNLAVILRNRFNLVVILSNRSAAARIPVTVNAASAVGVSNEELEPSLTGAIGADDLLIVGPGVLGRLVAENWQKEHPGSRIYGQTLTSAHHGELIKMGIVPCLKGTLETQQFPHVIFCAPRSRNPNYAGEVRESVLKWNGEGSFLFTSSSALYDCNNNESCDEDTPVVPIGKSVRTDDLLNAEKVVLQAGGCVVRLAGLYSR